MTSGHGDERKIAVLLGGGLLLATVVTWGLLWFRRRPPADSRDRQDWEIVPPGCATTLWMALIVLAGIELVMAGSSYWFASFGGRVYASLSIFVLAVSLPIAVRYAYSRPGTGRPGRMAV